MSETLRTEVKKVSLTAIRAELRNLWTSEALNREGVIRARSHNLVVYTDMTRHNVADLVEHIIRVNAQRPGRVILVQYDPGAADRLDAWVTVYCQPRHDHLVCSEMVVLEVGDDFRGELHSTVVALLAADLPIYLWWMQLPDPDDHLYRQLSLEADRLIVDSDFFRDMAAELPALLALGGIRVSDLAWARLTPWRRHLAQFWDLAHLRAALAHLHRLEVRYGARTPGGDANRALLLTGWLAARLEWELAGARAIRAGGYDIAYRAGGAALEVRLLPEESPDVPQRELASVTLGAGEEPASVSPRLTYRPEHRCIEIDLCSAIEHDWAFRPVGPAEALAEELDHDYDLAYRAALERAVEVVQACRHA